MLALIQNVKKPLISSERIVRSHGKPKKGRHYYRGAGCQDAHGGQEPAPIRTPQPSTGGNEEEQKDSLEELFGDGPEKIDENWLSW